MPDETLLKPNPLLRRSFILADTGIDGSTLNAWVKDGSFPKPVILNPGAAREICGWYSSDYAQWKASRPRRAPKPITDRAYSPEARAKGQATRAAKRAQSSAPTPAQSQSYPRPRIARPRN